jgi:uncharacterized protein (DUF58 family)
VRPTGDAIAIAVLAAFLLFVAFNLQAGWVFGVDSLLIGLLAVGWLSARTTLRGVAVRRQMVPEAFEGATITVSLTITVQRGRRYFLELRDVVPGLNAATSVVPVCDSRRPTVITYRSAARRRGVHHVATVDVHSGGLAGLFTSRRSLEAPTTLTIFPQYWPLPDFLMEGGAGSEAVSTPLPARQGLEAAGVREFRDGDSLRHVHWRSTARRGTLVVREFERTVRHPLALLLDTGAAAYASWGGREAFEDLVRAAASIAFAVTQAGRDVHLVAASGQTPLTAVTGWREALHWLARVQADGGLSLAEVYEATLPEGTGVVVCSPRVDAVAMLAHRGVALAAVLSDVVSYGESPSVPSGGVSSPADGRGGEGGSPDGSTAEGETLLDALGVPSAVLRHGAEVGVCLRSLNR